MRDVLRDAVAAGLQAFVGEVVQAKAAGAPESLRAYAGLHDAAERALQPSHAQTTACRLRGIEAETSPTVQADDYQVQNPNEAGPDLTCNKQTGSR